MCRNISTKSIEAAALDYSGTIYNEEIYFLIRNTSIIPTSTSINTFNKKYMSNDLACAGRKYQFDARNIVLILEEDNNPSPFIQWIETTFKCDFIQMKKCMYDYLAHTFMDISYMIRQLIDELYKVFNTGRDYSDTINFVKSMIK